MFQLESLFYQRRRFNCRKFPVILDHPANKDIILNSKSRCLYSFPRYVLVSSWLPASRDVDPPATKFAARLILLSARDVINISAFTALLIHRINCTIGLLGVQAACAMRQSLRIATESSEHPLRHHPLTYAESRTTFSFHMPRIHPMICPGVVTSLVRTPVPSSSVSRKG